MRFSSRNIALIALASLALVASACGSSSSGAAGSSASANAGRNGGGFRGPFVQLTASQRSCLQKAGLFSGRRPAQGRRPGQRPRGKFIPGQRPKLTAAQRKRFQQRAQKMQAAFKKCGVKFVPGVPRGAGPRAPDGATQN